MSGLWASTGDVASLFCHEAPLASIWKTKPFLRSGWMKKGGISTEISFVNLGSFEMGTAELVLWWLVGQMGACKE